MWQGKEGPGRPRTLDSQDNSHAHLLLLTANRTTLFTSSALVATHGEPMDPLLMPHGFCWQCQNAGGSTRASIPNTKLIVMSANQSSQRGGEMSQLRVRSLCLQLIKCHGYLAQARSRWTTGEHTQLLGELVARHGELPIDSEALDFPTCN